MKILVFVGLASLEVACSGGGDRPGDPGPDDVPPPLPRIRVVTGVSPALITFREQSDTQWQTPRSVETGTFEFEAQGPYQLAIACPGSDVGAHVAVYARTPDDERAIDYSCIRQERPLHVRGEMLESGEVFFGGFGRGQSNAPWTFDLSAAAGTFDFVAMFGNLTTGPDRIAIRRDITITEDLDLGTIDAAHENTHALVRTRFTPTNLGAGDSLMADASLSSGNTFASVLSFTQPETAWEIALVPDAELRASDRQRVSLTARRPTTGDAALEEVRSLTRDVRANASTSVTLMDPIAVAFDHTDDRLTATWGTLPAYDELDLSRVSFEGEELSRIVSHDLVVSHAFIEAVGVTSLVLDFTDLPGFRPEWRLDPAALQVLTLDEFRTIQGETASSGVSQQLDPPPSDPGVRPSRLDAHARLLVESARAELRRARTGVQ